MIFLSHKERMIQAEQQALATMRHDIRIMQMVIDLAEKEGDRGHAGEMRDEKRRLEAMAEDCVRRIRELRVGYVRPSLSW